MHGTNCPCPMCSKASAKMNNMIAELKNDVEIGNYPQRPMPEPGSFAYTALEIMGKVKEHERHCL